MQENEGFSVFEMYNLAAQSHVAVSFEIPDYTNQTNVNGALLYSRIHAQPAEDVRRRLKFYQASTSEMYGDVLEPIQKLVRPIIPSFTICMRESKCILYDQVLPRVL